MSYPIECRESEILSKPVPGGRRRLIWRQFVQRLTYAKTRDTKSVQGVQEPRMDNLDTTLCPAVHPPFKGVDAWTGVPISEPKVIVGPWEPTTPDEVLEEQRRLLEEKPRRWWWNPRYRLADLERGGIERAAAVEQVRAEFGGDQ